MSTNTAEGGPVDPFAQLTGPRTGPPSVPSDPAGPVPAPPATVVAPHTLATPAALQSMPLPELQREILALLAAAERRSMAELAGDPRHADGTLAIDSMTAVFALAQIGGIVGRPKLVDLSATDPDELRSVAGVARLARAALDKLAGGPA